VLLNPLAWYERHLKTKLERADNYLGGLTLARAEFGVYTTEIKALERKVARIERRLNRVHRWLGVPEPATDAPRPRLQLVPAIRAE
jgi:hypothetical protein